MRRRGRGLRRPVCALTIVVLLAASWWARAEAATTDPNEGPGSPEVPVLAQTWIGGPNGSPTAVLTIHGVRRVEGASVLYYSMGIPDGASLDGTAYFTSYGGGFYNTLSQAPGASQLTCAAAAIDLVGGNAYTALRTGSAASCLGTGTHDDFEASPGAPHAVKVAYTLIAPIPSSVTTVDVFIGSQLLQDVPVEDGLMEPVATAPSPVVGTGWPAVDTSAVRTAVDPAGAVIPLVSRVESLASGITNAQGQGGSILELDSTVLFATDSSTLTGEAVAVLADVAARIQAAGVSGSVVVTGHTDSTNTDDYNLALSQRRAEAVIAALAPQLPPTIELMALGKGESEPIASNSSEEGRALNRRVTVTLPGPGGAPS